MTRKKWWFYSFHISTNYKSGKGNGMKRFGKSPTVKDWIEVAREVERNNHLPEKSVVITNFHPVTK